MCSFCSQPLWAWDFSGDFTTNLARQCRAFSRALKIEKLKAPLFCGPKGAGATNDWCITLTAYAINFDFQSCESDNF